LREYFQISRLLRRGVKSKGVLLLFFFWHFLWFAFFHFLAEILINENSFPLFWLWNIGSSFALFRILVTLCSISYGLTVSGCKYEEYFIQSKKGRKIRTCTWCWSWFIGYNLCSFEFNSIVQYLEVFADCDNNFRISSLKKNSNCISKINEKIKSLSTIVAMLCVPKFFRIFLGGFCPCRKTLLWLGHNWFLFLLWLV